MRWKEIKKRFEENKKMRREEREKRDQRNRKKKERRKRETKEREKVRNEIWSNTILEWVMIYVSIYLFSMCQKIVKYVILLLFSLLSLLFLFLIFLSFFNKDYFSSIWSLLFFSNIHLYCISILTSNKQT